ncbi:F-box protein At-B-like [Rutidosis leptorrhynchoides]|uniref:F-box protein At-B-like n=1 Tax=Rutidosis leptorrhynchoides TaxID=125765 RepID=UPI003A99C5A4
MAQKRSCSATVSASVGGDSLLERLPETLLNEILIKLSEESPETILLTLCSVACVSRSLHSAVNKTLSSFSSIDLSAFSLDAETFDGIKRRFGVIKNLTLDCFRLNDASIASLLGPHVEELNLLKCSALSYEFLKSIAFTCPNLRVLTLEFSAFLHKPGLFNLQFRETLRNCRYLESLGIKVRAGDNNDYHYDHILCGIYMLPQSIKFLKVEPASALNANVCFRTHAYTNTDVPISLTNLGRTLSRISLVLDIITNEFLCTIVNGLPLLTELDLKDRPTSEFSPDDLSDVGVQLIAGCKHLTCLSLIRSRQHIVTSFKSTTDMGMFLLAEGCKKLESVRLGGFSKVSDAGYTSILNSCLALKYLEIRNGVLLTDLTFQDVSKVPRSLTEVKLISCSFITSEAVCELATCSSLQVLDLLGCRSVSDPCLRNISCLKYLTHLNFGGADITDAGMAVLGKSSAQISYISLRGCKRVTDKGIALLLGSEGKISKVLSSLDLGHMPGISDDAITTIASVCVGLTELCIRSCFHVTDASVKVLALKKRSDGDSKFLRRLDIYNCIALSTESFEYLKKPLFCGLQWIGIGRTRLSRVGDGGLAEIYSERRWLTICSDGCELGCHDGWQFHKF